jgi:hypothetical protein
VIDSAPTGLIGVSSVTFTFHGSDTNDTFQWLRARGPVMVIRTDKLNIPNIATVRCKSSESSEPKEEGR